MAKMQMQQAQNMQSKQADHAMNLEQMQMQSALQNNSQDIQSKGNSGTDEEAALKEVIKLISQMSPEEVAKLAESNPQIAQLLELLQSLSPEELQSLQSEIQAE
jgi:hypothetical protein